MRFRFEVLTDAGFVPLPDPDECKFQASLGGESTGYFVPQWGEVGDYIHAIDESGEIVAGFFVVKPEDYDR